LVKHSCTTRNIVISVSFAVVPDPGEFQVPPRSGCASRTLLYTTQSRRQPGSSSSGGCSRCEIVRISRLTSSTNPAFSATHFAASGVSLLASDDITARFIPIAASNCPTLSCSSRPAVSVHRPAMRSRRADKSRKLSVAVRSSAVRSSTRFSRSSRASLNDCSNCRCSSTFVAVPYQRVIFLPHPELVESGSETSDRRPSAPRSGNSISKAVPPSTDAFQRSRTNGNIFASCTDHEPFPPFAPASFPCTRTTSRYARKSGHRCAPSSTTRAANWQTLELFFTPPQRSFRLL